MKIFAFASWSSSRVDTRSRWIYSLPAGERETISKNLIQNTVLYSWSSWCRTNLASVANKALVGIDNDVPVISGDPAEAPTIRAARLKSIRTTDTGDSLSWWRRMLTLLHERSQWTQPCAATDWTLGINFTRHLIGRVILERFNRGIPGCTYSVTVCGSSRGWNWSAP